MVYKMQISAAISCTKFIDIAPAKIETLTDDSAKVTDAEIKLVTEAFACQIEQHIRALLKMG